MCKRAPITCNESINILEVIKTKSNEKYKNLGTI